MTPRLPRWNPDPAFEAWARRDLQVECFDTGTNGQYLNAAARYAWLGWTAHAATAQAVETTGAAA